MKNRSREKNELLLKQSKKQEVGSRVQVGRKFIRE